MKLGIVFINTGARSGQSIIELARRAEAVGIESVWTGEHVIIPLEYSSPYPYNDTGKLLRRQLKVEMGAVGQSSPAT